MCTVQPVYLSLLDSSLFSYVYGPPHSNTFCITGSCSEAAVLQQGTTLKRYKRRITHESFLASVAAQLGILNPQLTDKIKAFHWPSQILQLCDFFGPRRCCWQIHPHIHLPSRWDFIFPLWLIFICLHFLKQEPTVCRLYGPIVWM